MPIRFEVEDAIACITIDRPERRNALDQEHYDALSAAWCRVRDDTSIRAAIITGAGDQASAPEPISNPSWARRLRWPRWQ